MIIVGFDPGLATLGYGVISTDKGARPEMIDYGIVSTPKDENLAVRLAMLEKGVRQIIDKFKPDEIAIEELFFAKNVKTGIAVAHARGVILL
ncbi:MAG: crossover junction endodeoxyribonuclease RuvC, partial [Clostridia bacterium]|nr:crossover junction endodeoxyribonuclease RuvC [Clostridia bacterium]